MTASQLHAAPRRLRRSAVLAGVFLACGSAHAAAVYYSIDLRGGVQGSSPTPFISFVVGPNDSNGDSWYETVMKINLRDPALANPYRYAQFRVSYDGAPTGLTVNIGDSATNDGGSGDAGTQRNDAELQIGAQIGDPVSEYDVLRVLANDDAPPAVKVQAVADGVATLAHDVFLSVGNGYAAWDNGLGVSGSVSSPYLYALNGQPDSEGPVNYDIYAAFNRVIGGTHRIGAGVGQVTVCLSTDESCFTAIPVPTSLSLALLGLGLLGGVCRRRAPPQAAAGD